MQTEGEGKTFRGDHSDAATAGDEEILLTPPASPHKNDNNKPKKVWSKLALQRRKKLEDARRAASRLQNRELRKKSLQKGWQSAKVAINKVNIGKWIDDLEKDQELADELERINEEHQAEAERRHLVVQVREACMDAIRTHLVSFLQENPEGSYEDWVAELHPDNVSEHDASVDHRFYVEDSDHRILWNEHHQNTDDHAFGFSKFVPAASTAQAQTETNEPANDNKDPVDAGGDGTFPASRIAQEKATQTNEPNNGRGDPVINQV